MEIAPSPGDTGKAQRPKSLVGPGCFCYFHLGAYWLESQVGSMVGKSSENERELLDRCRTRPVAGCGVIT